MMIRHFCYLLIIFIVLCLSPLLDGFGQPQATRHETFQYKYSFKPPYLAQKDGTVPFWQYYGIAIASEEMVKLTPSLKSKRGSIWTKQPTSGFKWWEVEIWFRVTGRGRLGADGLAFFYTTNILPEGPVFGSADRWNGLGIFFDSFDNDQKSNNPYIMAMVNDGTKEYHHDLDGNDQQLAGCLRDFRNKPYPTRVKIEYYNNKLSLLFHNGNTNNDEDYELCFESHDVHLPAYGHFGLSAATGQLSDDHDVLKVLTHSLLEPGQYQTPEEIKDREKYNKEYEEYKHKMDQKQQDYLKAHPDEQSKHNQFKSNPEDEYETLGEREFQQILSAQGEVHDILRGLNHKLDEILGKQERSLSMMSALQSANYQHPQQPQQQYQQQPQQQIVGQSPIQRHEFEALLAQQNELVGSSRQIKQSILAMANQPINNNQPASVQQAHQFNQQILSETREGVNTLRKELANIGTKLMSQQYPQAAASQYQQNCPTCLSTTTFLVAIIVQLVLVIGYNFWQSTKDNQSKKFY